MVNRRGEDEEKEGGRGGGDGRGARQREGKIKREGCESLGFHFVLLHAPESSRIMISVEERLCVVVSGEGH